MDSSFPLSPSSEHASRSSSLRQQREAALRRRQSLVPPRRDSHCADSARPASRRMSLGAINAISDVMAWEEAKTKERIEARIRKDEDKRAREATKSPEVEVDDREVRMKEQWSPEAKARAEAACKLEEDARKLAEANAAEAQRREKERFADLERRLAEAERARSEAEQLAERALLLERHHTLHGSDKISNGRGNLSDTINSPSTIHPKASHSNHSSVPQIMNESAHTALEQHNSTMGGYNEVARVHVPPDTMGRNSGYERYLATFHQPSKVDDSSITGSDDTEQNKQSVSSSSDDDTSRKKDSNNPGSKISSLPKVSSIDSINLDDPKAMRCFLMKPCPKGEGMVQCSVRRNKGLFPEYRMYLSRSNSKTETFLLTSKKRGKCFLTLTSIASLLLNELMY